MPQSPSSLSRCLLLISVAVAGSACGGDDACGPGSAPQAGLLASANGIVLTYGNLQSGLNNDCPSSDAPAGVTSLTIIGTQTDGSGGITMCVSRPDLLAAGSLALGPDLAGSPVRLIDLNGSTANGCTYALDTTRLPTGSIAATGLCGDGSDVAGFALTASGAVPLTQTCAGSAGVSVGVTLTGSVAVSPDL
jgi:hypothetical protein